MSDFQVMRASEIPNRASCGRHSVKYPFGEMAVGDAFLCPADHPGAQRSARGHGPRIVTAAHNWGRVNGAKFSCFRQPDGSIRVERVA